MAQKEGGIPRPVTFDILQGRGRFANIFLDVGIGLDGRIGLEEVEEGKGL